MEPLAPSNRTTGILTAQASTSAAGVDGERNSDPDYISRIRVRLREVDENNDNDAAIQDDGEVSEHEEQDNNQQNAQQDDVQDQLRNEEAAAENESDTEFNFNEAETDSDSDDNQSTQDAQRSVQTGATAGSDTGDDSLINFISWEGVGELHVPFHIFILPTLSNFVKFSTISRFAFTYLSHGRRFQ